jgi:AcrR family transcriptional regulator
MQKVTTEESEPGLRERKKAANRAKVLNVARKLFAKQGFDATTLEQICHSALISKRSFFRYFTDKESLVFPNREERLENFATFLMANQEVDNPFDSLRAATQVFGAEYNEHKEHLLDQQALIYSSLELRGREREIDKDWQDAIARAFSARAGNSPDGDLWARVLAGAIMGVVRSTMNFWFDHDCDPDLTQLGLDALNYLERGFPHRADPLPTEEPPAVSFQEC